MPEMSADAAPSASTTKLRQVLGPVDGAVIAMSNTAPTMSIGIGMGVIAGIVDGRTPAIVLLAFLPILGIASAYARLNRVERNLGNGYVWVGRALSPFLGFQVGWIQIVGSTLYLAYGSQVCGSMLLQFANEAHLRSVFGLALDPLSISLSTVLGVLVLLLVSYAAIRGADVAARFQTYLIVFEYAVLLGFCGYALFAGHQRRAARLLRLRPVRRSPCLQPRLVQPLRVRLGECARRRPGRVGLHLLGLGQRVRGHGGDP